MRRSTYLQFMIMYLCLCILFYWQNQGKTIFVPVQCIEGMFWFRSQVGLLQGFLRHRRGLLRLSRPNVRAGATNKLSSPDTNLGNHKAAEGWRVQQRFLAMQRAKSTRPKKARVAGSHLEIEVSTPTFHMERGGNCKNVRTTSTMSVLGSWHQKD